MCVAAAVLVSSCGRGTESAGDPADEQVPMFESVFPGATWDDGSIPEKVGDSSLTELSDDWFGAPTSSPGVLSMLVVHEGKVIFERTADGVSTEEPTDSWSIAKSVLGAAVGIAVDRGTIALTDDHLHPSWTGSDPRSDITVADLLHMAGGLAWDEDWRAGDALNSLQDPVGAATFSAAKAAVNPPGTVFHYSSGNSSILAGYLASQLGGPDALESFVRREIFDPIGITTASFVRDGSGTWPGSVGLRMSPRDYARFGLLLLNDGRWGTEQVLPEGWLEYARTEGVLGSGYGAHLWLHTWPVYSADGVYGQVVAMNPATATVVVVTSEEGASFERGLQLALRAMGVMSFVLDD
jgi:CubicO group peptidase (beta-lactamase class C family)